MSIALSNFSKCLRIVFANFYVISTSTSLALSIYVFFISLMHSVDGAQFLNTTFLFLLFGVAAFPVFGTVTVSLIAMYTSV